MPLSGVGTYIPTIKEFLNHWNTMNIAVGERVTLAGGFGIQDLDAMRQELATAIADVQTRDEKRMETLKDKDALLVQLRERVKQFRAMIAAKMPTSKYRKLSPTLPTFTASEKLQMQSFDVMVATWEMLNQETGIQGYTPPMKLAGGYTLEQAHSDLSALKATYVTYTAAVEEAARARKKRIDLMKNVATRLRQYRQAAVAYLPTGHALLDSLPAVAPTGAVDVAAVQMTADWDPMRGAAVLSWTAAPPENHERFEVRYHPGPKYKETEEQVVGSVLKGVLSVITDYGLATPGSVALFRVYNITSDGEEKGSNVVHVERP
jgi:hypothetical protein